MVVRFEERARITDFYPLSMTAIVQMTEWNNFVKKEASNKTGMSRYVTVCESNIGGDAYLHCKFDAKTRPLTLVACRHFGFKMGILREVGGESVSCNHYL